MYQRHWRPIGGTADEMLRKRLTWLIVFRLAAVIVLLGAAFLLDRLSPPTLQLASRLSVMIFTVGGLTLFYTACLRFSVSYRLQAYWQMTGDILLVTGLVYLTGTIESPFTALYLIIIFVTSSLISRRGTFALTALACVCYVALAYGVHTQRLPLPPEYYARVANISPHTLESAIGFNLFAFFAIAFLGSQLNERLSRTDENLAQAHRNLDDLRAFSERVIDSISSGLVTTDLRHHIISFNRAAEEITGYRAEQVAGQHLSALFPGISSYLDAGLQASLAGQHLSRLNLECRTASERQIQLGLSISPLTSTDGEITGFVLPFQDLTEVIQLEREVRRQDRLAALGRVAAAIAHEIRNPLASMRGAVQVLGSESSLSDEQTQLMNIVLRESDRLERIISDFLLYARPRRPELSRVDLNEVLEETFALLRFSSEINSESHQLLARPLAEPALVEADAGQLRQVFWNLSRNAVIAMPEGGTLTIAIERTADQHVQVVFHDSGIGMNEEQLERIFEPFSSSGSGGTGLGMSIVYQIINEHRGKISIHSEVGRGTAITIRLAALPVPQSAAAPEAAVSQSTS
jgi:two-component system sensor histidine kinase PilS (NtrC family)